MRCKAQWKYLLLLFVTLTLIGIYWVDQELKPAPDAVYTTVQERIDTPKLQWSPDGSDTMFVNSFQTYGFIAFAFLFLMAAQNLVHLHTPMMLTRYQTYYGFRWKVFCNLFKFSIVFLSIATILLLLAEQTASFTGLGNCVFIAKQIYPTALAMYILHMLLCTAMVCLYQSVVFLTHNYVLSQIIPMLFFIASSFMQGTWITKISPFSFPVYDSIPKDKLWWSVLTYVVCFGVLIGFLYRPRKENFVETRE